MKKGLSKTTNKVLVTLVALVMMVILIVHHNPLADPHEEKIKKMIDERNEARANKDYTKADKIRDDLLAMGIKIIDSKDGQRWERI